MNTSASDRFFPGAWTAGRSERDLNSTSAPTHDEALMQRVQAGDEIALGVLLDRHARLVIRIGLKVLRDAGEAQELVQEAFLQVYRKSHLFDPTKGSFRSWLIRLASNRAFDRREYLNLHRFYDDRNLDDFAEIVQSAVDVEYQAQVNQSEAELKKAFQQLSDKQRATLELYFFEGYTLREISERLNESLANVRHYYYRALERLKAGVRKVEG